MSNVWVYMSMTYICNKMYEKMVLYVRYFTCLMLIKIVLKCEKSVIQFMSSIKISVLCSSTVVIFLNSLL